jgi:sulfoxide reductase catalytic subunit YedY
MDKTSDRHPDREITSPTAYANRRTFMRAGVLAATTLTTAWLYRKLNAPAARRPDNSQAANSLSASAATLPVGFGSDERKTPLADITHYNNFYEFSTDKESVADAAAGFVTRPWTVSVEGLVRKPKVFDLDDLARLFPPEERVYRMRCVEAWSMVIPWDGFSLRKLLDYVEPVGDAKFVQFQTLHDTTRMPGQRISVLEWPYVEGLRMDEAMHPLTILATGIYGQPLPPQDGAPVRLVVPWKYGFKGIKSIVRIQVVPTRPPTTWSLAGPDEYGFYANVNPQVDHPRWSQATERRIGEFGMRDTLMFNGYADQVASMYAGIDLRRNF